MEFEINTVGKLDSSLAQKYRNTRSKLSRIYQYHDIINVYPEGN